MKLLTTKQAAAVLGVTDRRVRAMIGAGQLPAHHLGRDYAIEEKVLHAVAKIERRPGRPPRMVSGGRGATEKTTKTARPARKESAASANGNKRAKGGSREKPLREMTLEELSLRAYKMTYEQLHGSKKKKK